jgi:hypothetical protein
LLINCHTVAESRARGWEELENGELLNEAEAAGFEELITTDKNLSYQQNLTGRKIAIVVLGQGRWSLIKPHVAKVVAALNAAPREPSPRSPSLTNSLMDDTYRL